MASSMRWYLKEQTRPIMRFYVSKVLARILLAWEAVEDPARGQKRSPLDQFDVVKKPVRTFWRVFLDNFS